MNDCIQSIKNLNIINFRFLIFLIGLFLIIILYHDSFESMIRIWMNSETYSHCIVIAPISLFLIWKKRNELELASSRFEFLSALFILLTGIAWWIGSQFSIQLVQHICCVLLIQLLVWFVFGKSIFAILFFPLMYLVFLIPFGEILIGPMIKITGFISVMLLKLINIPVYYEGNIIYVPSGKWMVDDACSGIRYIVASVALGVLYSFYNYSNPLNRLLFIMLSVILPIIANGIRAFLIITIGHLTHMRLAAGIDHIIYGWLFFAIVILILFLLGNYWKIKFDSKKNKKNTFSAVEKNYESKTIYSLALVVMLISISIGPALGSINKSPLQYEFVEVENINGWKRIENHLTTWQPSYFGAQESIKRVFEKNNVSVELQVYLFSNNGPGKELINSKNRILMSDNPTWSLQHKRKVQHEFANKEYIFNEFLISSEEDDLLIWNYYSTFNHITSNKFVAKLYEIASTLINDDSNIISVFIVSNADTDFHKTQEYLQQYFQETQPLFKKIFHRALPD